VSSLGATRAIPNYTAVGASKAALESMSATSPPSFAPEGLRINAVSAGTVDTDALLHFPNREELLEAARRRTACGPAAEPAGRRQHRGLPVHEYASMIHGQVIVGRRGVLDSA